jgi:hypothetical protein
MSEKVKQIFTKLEKSGFQDYSVFQMASSFMLYIDRNKEPGMPLGPVPKEESIALEIVLKSRSDFELKSAAASFIFWATQVFVRQIVGKSCLSDIEIDQLLNYNIDFLAFKFGMQKDSKQFLNILCFAEIMTPSEMNRKYEKNVIKGLKKQPDEPTQELKGHSFNGTDFSCNVCQLKTNCEKNNYPLKDCYILDFAGIKPSEIFPDVKTSDNDCDSLVGIDAPKARRLLEIFQQCRIK